MIICAVAGTDAVLAQYAEYLERTVEMAQLPGHPGATLAGKVNGTDNKAVSASCLFNKRLGKKDSHLISPTGSGPCGPVMSVNNWSAAAQAIKPVYSTLIKNDSC